MQAISLVYVREHCGTLAKDVIATGFQKDSKDTDPQYDTSGPVNFPQDLEYLDK